MAISNRASLWTRAALLAGAASVLFCPPLQAQAGQEKAAPDSAAQIQKRVELVNVDVAVTDRRGNFVRNLKRENFRIFDNGVEQPITHFAPVEEPAVVLVLVETGPAVYLIQRQHLAAAQALFDGLAAEDWVGLGTYDKAARVRLGLTQDKSAVQRGMLGPQFGLGMGQLNLSEGVSEALTWLSEVPAKKAIVLISTGLDTSAPGRWEALLDELRGSDVAIFAVGMGGNLRDFKDETKYRDTRSAPLSFERAARALRILAGTTGGRAWFPRSPKEFPAIYGEIALVLRHRYSLGFAPPARDARLHRIEVQVVTDTGRVVSSAKQSSSLRIFTRHGYVAPGP